MGDIHLTRRLKAVLLADVVGYSRLMGIDEERTHVQLAGYVSDLIEPKVAEFSGRLIRSMGDGFLVEFDSAADAVSCALEIQRELARREAEADADRRIRLRIGINTGDVVVRDMFYSGDPQSPRKGSQGATQTSRPVPRRMETVPPGDGAQLSLCPRRWSPGHCKSLLPHPCFWEQRLAERTGSHPSPGRQFLGEWIASPER